MYTVEAMDVTFETPAGRRFNVEVGYLDTVAEMKEKIQRYEGIPVMSQRLFFQGVELVDDLNTEYYSIMQGSHVLLLMPPYSPSTTPVDAFPSSRTICVLVSLPGVRRRFATELKPFNTTVAQLKELIQEHTEGTLPVARQVLLLDMTTELLDQKTLAEYNPPNLMEVRVLLRPVTPQQPSSSASRRQPRMTVTVRFGAKTAGLDMCVLDTVAELRRELLRAGPRQGMQLPTDGLYFFVYKEKLMEEDRTLAWHDVKPGDTIEISDATGLVS